MGKKQHNNNFCINSIMQNKSFTSEATTIAQTMVEFMIAVKQLNQVQPYISILGSAKCPASHKYYKLAQAITTKLANAGFTIVTGGNQGIMKAANTSAQKSNATNIILKVNSSKQTTIATAKNLTLNFQHSSTRKIMLFKYASALVILPGGFGTLDEFTEILALSQNNEIKKIPIFLVKKTFWQPLLTWFNNTLVANNMVTTKDLQIFTIVETPTEILQHIKKYQQHHNFLKK